MNRCFFAVGRQWVRSGSNKTKSWILQELGSVGVPPPDGGRFRRMPDIALASFNSDGMEAAGRLVPNHMRLPFIVESGTTPVYQRLQMC